MIKVVIADDHHLVRVAIRKLLEECGDVEVIGEAADGHEALRLVQELEPHVIVMDIAMPRMDGSQATRQLRALNTLTKIVILSMHADAFLAQQLLQQGVKGYLLKNSVAAELPLAIRAASQGKVYLSPLISDDVLHALMSPAQTAIPEHPSERLTPREREVLQLIAKGYTNGDVAAALQISIKTVEKHRGSLMSKLRVNDLASLMRLAIRYGLVSDGSTPSHNGN
jgi:DNA-binding NarL/FixJ family response regulator